MKQIFILLTALSFSILSFAQQATGKISGSIKDGGNQKIIDAATISLLKLKDSSLVKTAITDKDGNFALENIKNGNPTRVYSSSSEISMFFMITRNNIMVSFMVFVYGVFASLGTGLYLFYNGLMVGTFVMFFFKEQQLDQALPVIKIGRAHV